MNDNILVVEKNRNGKIVNQYYITRKEAQKHRSARHKRYDRYGQGGKKKTRARTSKKNRTRKFH